MAHNYQTYKKVLSSYIESTGVFQTIGIVIFWVIVAFLWVLEPLIFIEIIKKIESFMISGEIDIAWTVKIFSFWIVYTVSLIILMYCYDYFCLAKTIIKNYHDISLDYAKKSIKMTMWSYLGKQVWWLYKILDRGTENQLFLLYWSLLWVLRNIFGIIFIAVILFVVDWRMALWTLALVPVVILIGYFIFSRVSPKQIQLDEVYIQGFWIMWNGLSNFWLTKILCIEGVLYEKMKKIFDDSFQKQLNINKWWSLGHGYTAWVVMISRIIVILLWLYLIIQWQITFSTVFLFFSYIWYIYFPLEFLFNQLRQFQKYISAIEIMHNEFDFLDYEDQSWKTITKPQWNISFHQVSFGYHSEQSILRKVSLDIHKGEQVALVWNTGAGKSTIVNLLLRFWDIEAGTITLDGQDIRNIKKSSLRKHIWVVSQDNSLFNLSIEENLRFANPKATKKEIETALKNAQADFVFSLKHGIKTVIGERWLKLSGGEKQRISIARLFLKNPEILLLDEATSALDNATEKKIEIALKKLMKWKTSIIIAHRLSTIMHVDKIYVLEEGRVVEVWNYDQLMKQKGKFYALAHPDKLILW